MMHECFNFPPSLSPSLFLSIIFILWWYTCCQSVMLIFNFMPLAGSWVSTLGYITPALRRPLAVYFKVVVTFVDIDTTLLNLTKVPFPSK